MYMKTLSVQIMQKTPRVEVLFPTDSPFHVVHSRLRKDGGWNWNSSHGIKSWRLWKELATYSTARQILFEFHVYMAKSRISISVYGSIETLKRRVECTKEEVSTLKVWLPWEGIQFGSFYLSYVTPTHHTNIIEVFHKFIRNDIE